MWHYAGRNWGFIGHDAILVASSCRLLATIGWQHSEHVLGYVVQGLAGWGAETKLGKGYGEHPDVRPYWGNLKRVENAVRRLPGDWAESEGNEGLTKDLLALLREGKGDEACDLVVKHLTESKAKAGAVWDAVHLAAGELVISSKTHAAHRPVNSSALHSNTATNALHFTFLTSGKAETRLLLTLQAVAWMDLYRRGIVKGKHLTDPTDITALTGPEVPEKPEAAIDEILATRTEKPREAGRLAFAFARRHRIEPLLAAARRLLPTKSSGDPHDIKFPVAVFEDLGLVSPAWQPHLLAAAVHSFWGSDRPDNPAMLKVREAVRGL